MSFARLDNVGKVKLTLLRGSQGKYVDGKWTGGDIEEVCILANIQPAKPSETLLLSEADRTRYTLKIFSCSEIRKMREGTNGWDADTFVWEGDVFEVMRVSHFSMSVLDHYSALACLSPLSQES